MALRFYSELQSSEGNVWKVELYDSDFSGSSASFTLAAPGFTLSYTGGQDVFSPLMPSTCTVHMMAQNAAELQLITDLSDFQEGRFIVRVIADPDGAADVHWVGMMTAESIAVVDEYYPQAIDMRAICGLATLSTVGFISSAWSSTTTTTLGRVYQSLAQIPTRDIFGASDIYLTIGTDVQPDTLDEFFDDVIWSAATYSEGVIGVSAGSCEEKLIQILTLLNSRLSMSSGRWEIMPIVRMMDIDTLLPDVRRYKKDGVLLSTGTDNVSFTLSQTGDNYRLAGWETRYLPAVRKITRQLSYFGNAPFLWSGVTDFHPIGSASSPNSVTATYDAGATLATTDTFTITASLNVAQGWTLTTGDAKVTRYRLELTVRVGTKYLARSTPFDYSTTDDVYVTSDIFNPGNPNEPEWTTNSASRVTAFTEPIIVDGEFNVTGFGSLEFSIDAPEIGTTEDADIEIVAAIRGYHGVADASNTNAYTNSSGVLDNCTATVNVALYIGGTGDSGDILTYSASIANGATEEIEVVPSLHGEITSNLTAFNPGALQILGGGAGGNPTGFTSTGTTVAAAINELVCLDRLRHMAKQQEVHSGGAICGDLLTPFKRVDIGSKYYLISQLSFTAEQDAYDIELTLAEDLSSTPTPGDVVRSSVLPTHTTAGAAQAAAEGARRLMLQNTSGIADLSTSVDTKLTQIELDDLTDVDTTTRTPVDGDVLEWAAASSEWQPATPSGGGGGVTSVTGTTPIASTGGTTPAISIAAATTGAAGSMSAADKTKLDGVATGAVSFPSEHCLWKGAATSGTAGSNTLSLSVTGNYVSWSTLKAYYTVDVDTGTNTDADKVYTIPTTGLYEFNTLAVFINTAGTDGTICKIILAINRDGSPADLCTRATIEIPAGQYTGASGTLVFEATAGEEITPAIYFRRNGTGGTFKLTYFHTYLHAAIRRIA